MTVVDSSGWIEFFLDGPKAENYARYLQHPEKIFTPVIVVYEVYKKIKVAMSRPEHTVLRDEVLDDGTVVTVQRSEPVPGISVQRAIAEYRRVAAMWGVET